MEGERRMNRTMEDIQWRVASDDPLSAAWDREDALGRMLEEARETITKLRSILGNIKDIEMDWGIDFNHASITVTHFTGLMLSGELKLEMMD